MTTENYNAGLERLRRLYVGLKDKGSDVDYQKIVQSRDITLAQFKEVFQHDAIKDISKEVFKSFLLFKNNRHWFGLQRHGNKMCADINKLRATLMILLDEKKSIQQRLDQVVEAVPGMGKAVITAILLFANPGRYGVWNNTSEGALQILDLWPNFERGSSFGGRYEQVNQLLNRLARDLGIDLWTLDALFWEVSEKDDDTPVIGEVVITNDERQRFALEKHLHEFLWENWEKTELAQEWALYDEPGKPEAYEYPTKVGRIDLLAKHLRLPRWLVVELKRGQSNDDTVGQVLRYIGWVKNNLAKDNEEVRGLIIAHDVDESLLYALSAAPNVELLLYEVSFSLLKPKPIDLK
jgi:hypothetical protein